MDFLRIYGRVLGLLRPERRLAITLAVANVVVAALAYVEPVLFGRIVDVLAKGIDSAGERNLGAEHPAAGDLGRRRAGRHRRQHPRLAARRPAGAPAPAGGDGAVLRARPEPAARLPQRLPLRPRPEDHAGRRRQPVRRLARLLPRASGDLRRHPDPAAAVAAAELAAGPAAGRADRDLRGADRRWSSARTERRRVRSRNITRAWPRAPATRSATCR